MSIRIGSNYIAGSGGGSVDTDDVSITTNTNHEIQSIGNVNKNTATGATAVKYDWIGTLAEFNQQDVANTHPEWICYVTDDVAGGESVYTKEEVDEMIKCRRIGEIIQSSIPLTDAGIHLLDGSLISGSGAYADFVTYMAGLVSSYPDIFETETAWQQAVTDYGVCGKFVYDSTNNTVRLPKITGFTEGTTDVAALGDLIGAGLPNITGEFRVYSNNSDPSIEGWTGAFGRNNKATGTHKYNDTSVKTSSFAPSYIDFDASRSSSIYGNSTTVQPQAIKVLYYIVIANSVKTNIEVDIDEVMTDLNAKVDKADLSPVDVVVETYVNGTSWYRIWSDGWIEQGGFATRSAATQTVTFPKAFADTNYNIQISARHTTDSTDGRPPLIRGRTKTDFTLNIYTSYEGAYWLACGYGA